MSHSYGIFLFQPQYVAPEPGQATQQVLPRERRPGFPVTWTGPGFMRAQHGAVLRFTVPNIPAASLQYHLLLHYEPQVSASHHTGPGGVDSDGDNFQTLLMT